MIRINFVSPLHDFTRPAWYFTICFMVTILLSSCNKEEQTSSPNAIIPKPSSLQVGTGHFTIDKNTTIKAEGNALAVGQYLANTIARASSFEPSLSSGTGKNVVTLEIVPSDSSSESYELLVNENEILIQANTSQGLFYGVQTLHQLFPASFDQPGINSEAWRIPSVAIKDKPRFAWRGMHLDVSRHFFSVQFVKKFIDRLALYKFNKLHLHLTDDQGWRLQIAKYPQLTDKGAWRIFNNQDSGCVKLSAKNPDFALPPEFLKDTPNGKLYGGFYSQEDIKEILAYATAHFVTIIPEIDMPGHMAAAINEFPQLTCVDAGGWGKLFSTPLCPCEETTYGFLEDVVKEVAGLFPGEYIHIGADEVDERTWRESTSCKKFLKEKKMKPEELHTYFVNRVNQIVNRYGKKTIGWDEIMDGNPDSSVAVMYWRGWVPNAPVNAANTGHQVIMSPTSHCYFDYEPDNNSVQHMYDYEPVPTELTGNKKKNIVGLQANIWTEYIPTTARLDYMTMPRMIALAEVGWSDQRDWDDFTVRIKEHYPRWDAMDIRYRLPDIENLPSQKVFIDTTTFKLSIPFGVNEVRYTLDGTEPNKQSPRYEKPLVIDSSMVVKTLTLGHNGRRGNRKDVFFEKQSYLQNVTPGILKEGVFCQYYETSINSVNAIDELAATKSVVLSSVEFPSFRRPEIFGLKFTGFVEVPSDGIYTFFLSSDDGSSLVIGDRLVVNNDGPHGNKEVAGQIALKKGFHPYTLRYFDGGGGNTLTFSFEGAGIQKQSVPGNILKLIEK